jgi:hypothetical protein
VAATHLRLEVLAGSWERHHREGWPRHGARARSPTVLQSTDLCARSAATPRTHPALARLLWLLCLGARTLAGSHACLMP